MPDEYIPRFESYKKISIIYLICMHLSDSIIRYKRYFSFILSINKKQNKILIIIELRFY